MKRKIFDHLGMKVFSFVIAVAIWIIVANVDDYKTTKEITGIEIEFINGDAITEKNKVYEVPEGTTVNVVVKGRRKIVEGLNSSDFKAMADLSKMSVTDAVSVDVSAVSSSVNRELTITSATSSVVIAVENKIERQLPVVVRALSEVAEGYAISNRTATPNLITVKGAESVVNTIEEVVVDVDVSGKNRNVTMQARPIFLDKSGRMLDASKFEFDVKQIETLVEILPTKELFVRLGTKGSPAEGFQVISIDYQPTYIYVVGKAGTLSQYNEIRLDDIDVTGLSQDLETSISVLDYLPENVSLVGDNPDIMVKVVVEKLMEKNLILDLENVSITGKNQNLEYTFLSSAKIQLSLKGLKEQVMHLNVSDFSPSIDVTGYGPGEYELKLKFDKMEGVEVVNNEKIKLKIEEKK